MVFIRKPCHIHPAFPTEKCGNTNPALTARLLVTGKILERGVMMPEHLDPEELMTNFSR
ncbi:MAG: hypothetical protein ACREKL_14355 [Chthoniobacterales bacterium]